MGKCVCPLGRSVDHGAEGYCRDLYGRMCLYCCPSKSGSDHVSSHGQLYVAFSRATDVRNVSTLIQEFNVDEATDQ